MRLNEDQQSETHLLALSRYFSAIEADAFRILEHTPSPKYTSFKRIYDERKFTL